MTTIGPHHRARLTAAGGDGVVALLRAVLRRTPPLRDAACRDQAELFDATTDADRDTALALCAACADLEACRQWMERTPRGMRASGVVGGRHHQRKEV